MQLRIDSEEQAWHLLEQLLSGKITVESVDDLVLGDWITSSVYVPGKRYD